MAQEQKQREKHEDAESSELPAVKPKDEKLAADVADVLDEIDAVLGDLTDAEAEAWVAQFVQRGGQ